MSRRRAKGEQSGGEHQHYRTPAWCVRAILPFLQTPIESRTFLDPCAGDGAILNAIREQWPGAPVKGIEIDPLLAEQCRSNGYECRVGDALTEPWTEAGEKFPVVVMNPPFELALEFVEKAQHEATEIAVLLRLGFLAGELRAAFHTEHPSDVYVLPQRPSFFAGKTDATDYAWFIWGGCRSSYEHGRVRVLDTTPKSVRCPPKPKKLKGAA